MTTKVDAEADKVADLRRRAFLARSKFKQAMIKENYAAAKVIAMEQMRLAAELLDLKPTGK